ncbi:AAA family ATPase [Arthrobacter sp. ES3-54]|uniref:AAA family ATPase n=1 Tax=Arthrobacter sp. ES3-54 TaxID=1502991 RepID=UPI002405B2F7|nr:AAA family ATPase [Arthrobacter sp. ES3-54]MDF9749188.1 ABC-type ATPase involved in cell division [Arthrobacter sp. ES3-54]
MTIRVRIKTLESNAGDSVEISESGVTCLVGGNNAGKSQTLRDIAVRMHSHDGHVVVLRELQLEKANQLLLEESSAFLAETAVSTPAHQPGTLAYSPMGGSTQIAPDTFRALFGIHPNSLGGAWEFFLKHWSAGSLSSFASASLGHVGSGTPASSPLHLVFRDGELEQALSDLAHEVFGERLTLDRANMDVRLRMGKVDVPIPLFNNPTTEYADAVAALPSLEDQGDGVKSFLGLALAVVTGHSQMLLIDEPEAFLHPGQARALGRWLGIQAKKRDVQVIVSTHNRDFVLGLLSGGAESDVRIVRIVRNGSINRFHELPPSDIAATWADPVLRYSNVLQGLFHRRVAICESDADCRFYGAVLDELAVETNRRSQADDILLVPSGGKDRIAALAKSMLQLGVETHAFGDFDVLNRKDRICGIVESVGGSWTNEMNLDFVAFARPVQEGHLWDDLKKHGMSAVPAGDPYSACERLLKSLDAMRVHIVPGGEMESFDRSIGVKGSPWVSAALEKGLHKSSQGAKDYVENILTPNELAG